MKNTEYKVAVNRLKSVARTGAFNAIRISFEGPSLLAVCVILKEAIQGKQTRTIKIIPCFSNKLYSPL